MSVHRDDRNEGICPTGEGQDLLERAEYREVRRSFGGYRRAEAPGASRSRCGDVFEGITLVDSCN